MSAVAEAMVTAGPRDALPSVCFVTPHGWPMLARRRDVALVGGAEVQQATIARELARRGHRVSMISCDFGQHDGEIADGVQALTMFAPDAGLPGLRFVHPRFTSLWAAMRRADADVYYYRTRALTLAFVVAFCRWHGRRSIYAAAHDNDFAPGARFRHARDRALFGWGLRHVDRVVVQSERQRELCIARGRADAELIPSCYGHRGGDADADGPVLWVATLRPWKQPERLFELAERLPELRFRVVGGPGEGAAALRYAEQLHERARALPNVEMLGFVPHADVERHFDGASAFVNTSAREGFPNTFLQAWSRGMPTLSFVDPQVTLDGTPVGRVVGSVDAMAETLRAWRADRAQWAAEGRRARAALERFHSTVGVGDAYQQLLFALQPGPRVAQ
jgi:glycosyltransferase involved in cell wall biosynthesis